MVEPEANKMADTSAASVDVEQTGEARPEKTMQTIIETTKFAAEEEKQLGVIEAAKIYPKALFWSTFFALGVIMVGYDAQIINSFYAMPAFKEFYGEYYDGEKQITAAWQSALGMGNPIGQILGSLACSWPSERWGRKKVMIACNILISAFNFMQFFAPNLAVLCAGEILAGLLWGTFVTLAPTYASEVAPVALRGILTAFINMAFVIGQFIGQGVVAGFQSRSDKWAYKAPFALQWLWPAILLAGVPFAPESPWWLVRKERKEAARNSLKRLATWKSEEELDNALLVIEQTDMLERRLLKSTSYMDCFKGVNLRRTEICAMAYMIQVLCGNPLMGYINYFFTTAGLDTDQAFNMGVGNTAIGFFATCVTWVVLSYFGRRRIYNTGLYIMTVLLFIVAIIDCIPDYDNKPGIIWAQGSLLDVWTFFYQLTVGPMTFVIISECSSTKLRSRTIAIATACQAACSIVTTVAVPYMFNPGNGNMRGKIGFFFGSLSFLCGIWSFFRLPETKNRTFEEIDIMFEQRVPTRQFKNYNPLELPDDEN
ncbi:hypothetical protein TRICI_000938 [Trichomonascus ciferrii]|uniref:Major facilitator superfamily (MFS) profile domain-containing protein n=1 Tax=Trichomonascus ciferrii TaxID=44093 RepID=A0A642VAU9_9ASCO|nr:hypothetical protein TRICI_000938 [Trichomonascus ciferrii]